MSEEERKRAVFPEIFKTFHFSSAHWLPCVEDDHPCRQIHGHNYKLEVYCSGPLTDQGWIVDYGDIKKIVSPVLKRIDHHCLNDIEGLGNPTSEMISRWLWAQLKPELESLSKLVLWETDSSGCVYVGQAWG